MKTIIKGSILASVVCSFMSQAEMTMLDMEVDGPTQAMQKKLKANSFPENADCSFNFNEIVDNRQNKKSVGYKGTTLGTNGFDSWLQESQAQYFQDLSRENANIHVNVKPALTRLYSFQQSMNIHGVSATVVDYEVNGSVVAQKHYRGFYVKTNWANGDSEFVTTLNYAINDVFTNMSSDLSSVCKEIADKT